MQMKKLRFQIQSFSRALEPEEYKWMEFSSFLQYLISWNLCKKWKVLSSYWILIRSIGQNIKPKMWQKLVITKFCVNLYFNKIFVSISGLLNKTNKDVIVTVISCWSVTSTNVELFHDFRLSLVEWNCLLLSSII